MNFEDDACPKINGKVLLYTSRDQDASPAMTITHDTINELPPILDKLAGKFSPIRSKQIYIHLEILLLNVLFRAEQSYLRP